jgi:hypothetical protein
MKRRELEPGDDPIVDFVDLEIPPLRPGDPSQLFKLAYDFLAIAKAEGIMNAARLRPEFDDDGKLVHPGEEKVSLLHGLAAAFTKGLDTRQLAGLLYGAMLVAQPKMKLAQVGRLIRPDTIPAIMDAIEAAYRASMPTAKDLAKDPTTGANGAPENSPDSKLGSNAGPALESPSASPTESFST